MLPLVVLFLIVLVCLSLLTLRRPKGYPPGPRGLPIVGYYPYAYSDHHYIVAENLAKSYGPVVGVKMANYHVVFINGWEAVSAAFANDDLIGRPDVCLLRDRFESGKHLGLVFTEGAQWKSHRRFTLHHFRNLGFGRRMHAEAVMDEVEILVKDLSELKGPFSLEEPMFATEINIIWSLLAGTRYVQSDPKMKAIIDLYRKAMSCVTLLGNYSVALPFLRYIFPHWSGYHMIHTSCKTIRSFIRESIKDHKANLEHENPRDFIGIYLKELIGNKEVNSDFSEEQLEGLCFDLIGATADTSTGVVAFAILLMCQHPSVQERLQREVDAVVPNDRLPTIDDRNSLSYVDALISEVIRMKSPAPIVIPHKSVRQTTIQGHRIPKDTFIMINAHSVLMDPEYWGDPEVFRPERFLTDEGKLRKYERFIPFGKGKRSCLGEPLAKMTTFLILASLAHEFSFSIAPDQPPPDMKGTLGITLNAPECKVLAVKRRPARGLTTPQV